MYTWQQRGKFSLLHVFTLDSFQVKNVSFAKSQTLVHLVQVIVIGRKKLLFLLSLIDQIICNATVLRSNRNCNYVAS